MGGTDQFEKLISDIHDTEQSITPPPLPTQKPRRLWEKLGFFNLLVLGFGTAAICAALTLLVFLWIVSRNAVHNKHIPQFWQLIVSHQWTTRAITLSSTVIRIATAAQLGIFTAIIAALILERVGAPRADLPRLSIMRCSNSGPNSLIPSLLSSMFRAPMLPYLVLITIAILDAFALQFTSTILLTDFSNAQVVLGTTSQDIRFGLHDSNLDTDFSNVNPYMGIDYWQNAPTTYNRFAEYKEAGSNTVNYMDTGTTYRGFLPFRNAADRSTTRNYLGPVTVVDTRVVCVKPKVSNITIDAWTEEIAFPTFSAMYDWGDLNPNVTGDGRFPEKVNCTIPTLTNLYKLNWATSLCSYEPGRNPARLNSARPDPGSSQNPNGQTSIHVLVNATGGDADWLRLVGSNATLEPVESSVAPWTHLQSDNVTVAVTVCFFNPLPRSYKLTVESGADGNDKTIEWNSALQTYNTSDVQNMYGATNQSFTPEERALLKLRIPGDWTAAEDENAYRVNTSDFTWYSLRRTNEYTDSTGHGIQQTSNFNDQSPYGDAVHRSHVAIFQATLQQTMNPALALQALWTILMQMSYYDFLPQFDISAPASYSMSSTRLIPTHWKAFAVVLGFIVLHFALVLIALVMLLRTEMSLLGNGWQVISQVVSTDTADIVHHAATSTDKEAMDSAKASGIDNDIIRMAKCENSGRVQATAIRRQGGQL